MVAALYIIFDFIAGVTSNPLICSLNSQISYLLKGIWFMSVVTDKIILCYQITLYENVSWIYNLSLNI